MNKLRILLTGGGGMVGSNLLEHSSIGEFDVLAPNRRELDLYDFCALKDYLLSNKPDFVIHAAGKVGGIQANIREPVSFFLENLELGRNIILATHQAGIRRLLNLGSSCMYPRNHLEPLREEMLLNGELEPTNEGYALAKVFTERLCKYLTCEDSNLQYKTLIPCNLFGRYDKFDAANSHLIPAIISKVHWAMLNGHSSVEIWGDGTARREFMYSGDMADALVNAIKHFDTVPSIMNLGIGYDFTINEYYSAVAEVLGFTGTFTHDLSKPVGMDRKLVSIERQKIWGWMPTHSLQDGIAKTYEFFLKDYRV